MTTIAYRDGQLAADSQFSVNGMAEVGAVKIKVATNDSDWRVMGKRVVAFAVDRPGVSVMEFVRRALADGLTEKLPLISANFRGIQAMLITEEGECFTWVYTHMPLLHNEIYHQLRCHTGPWAIGTGRSYAMGAMAVGGTVHEAVLAGISLDVFSGGDVQGFDLQEYLDNQAAERADLVGNH